MKEIIKDVAEVINNLVTLNLLDRDNVVSVISLNSEENKRQMAVIIYTDDPEILCLCLELFQELEEQNGHPLGVLENDHCSKLTVFYDL